MRWGRHEVGVDVGLEGNDEVGVEVDVEYGVEVSLGCASALVALSSSHALDIP